MSFISIHSRKKTWLKIALANLVIVAILGFLLRSKIVFTIPFLDFKNTLHAHSHYAFGGWVTLALVVLMVYEILPKSFSSKHVYQVIFASILLNAVGMLISFTLGGYNFYSILFSTLFIFTTYAFAFVFIRHVVKACVAEPVRSLGISAAIYLVLSSVGPFTLAYLLASGSKNAFLYKDAIYTYLHLQYSGFFALAIFALLFNRLDNRFSIRTSRLAKSFSTLLNLSVLPSLFLCYLWHYPGALYQAIAVAGSILIVLSVVAFMAFALAAKDVFLQLNRITFKLLMIAGCAFILKSIFQALTIFHSIGALVFSNRPVIIAFLHLVLLGFVSIYILSHYTLAEVLKPVSATRRALAVFAGAVIVNEVVLFSQGADIMLMHNRGVYPYLLWLASLLLLAGAILLLRCVLHNKVGVTNSSEHKKQFQSFSNFK